MGTKSSNAIGQAQQFMPQPTNLYQERLQGITPVKATPTIDKSSSESFTGALGSFIDFSASEAQRNDKKMYESAVALVQASSREDIEKLNMVDVAQKYGYGTLVDNPYFKAYASEQKGKRFMSTANAEYLEAYGDAPAKTMDEEQARYDTFMAEKQQGYLQNVDVGNELAFQTGFMSQKAQSSQVLLNQRSERDVDDRLGEVAAGATTQLNNIVYNAPSMSMEDVTKGMQEVFNGGKLSGLSFAARYKMASTAALSLAQTGVYTPDQMKEFLDKTSIETRIDGTSVPLSEMIGSKDIADMATQYQNTHITKTSLDIVDKYKNNHDMSQYDMDTAKLNASPNPADRQRGELMGAIRGQVGTQQNQLRAERVARLKAQAKAAEGIAKKQGYGMLIDENLKLAATGNHDATDSFGNTEGVIYDSEGKQVPQSMIQQAFFAKAQGVMQDTSISDEDRLQSLVNLMQYKGASSFLNTYQERLMYNMQSQSTEGLQQGIVEGTYLNLYNMFQVDHNAFQRAFGSDLTSAFKQIRLMGENSGEANTNAIAIGMMKWQQASNLSGEDRQLIKTNYSNYMSAVQKNYGSLPDIDGLFNMGEGAPTSLSFDQITRSNIPAKLSQQYMAMGLSAEQAVTQAGNDIRDQYVYKWGTLIPKSVFRNVYPVSDSESNAEYLGNLSLNYIAAQYMGDYYLENVTANDGRAELQYNEDDGSFTLVDTYNPSRIWKISRSTLYDEMKYLAGQYNIPQEAEAAGYNASSDDTTYNYMTL